MSRTTRKVQHWVKNYIDSDNYDPRNPYHNGRDGSSTDKYEAFGKSPKGYDKWSSTSSLSAWKDKRYTRRIIKARGKREIEKELVDLTLNDDEPNHKPKNKRNRHPELSVSPRRWHNFYSFTNQEVKNLDFTKIFYLIKKLDKLELEIKNLEVKKLKSHSSMINDIDVDILSVKERIDVVKNNLKKEREGK